MKVKIIDILVKLANGEEVPKKILYKYSYKDFHKEYRLKWDKKYKGYYTTNDKTPITHLLADNLFNLNDEVEIIEEPKEIEKLEKRVISENYMIENKNAPEEEKWKLVRNLIYNNSKDTQFVKDKINELIDVVNELKKENK